jgi:type I restriction enzyme M protein
LNPGRHVGVAPGEAVSDEDFLEQFELLNEEFQSLTRRSHELEDAIAASTAEILAE